VCNYSLPLFNENASAFKPGGCGARQPNCRLTHAAKGCLSASRDAAVTTDSRSGLSITASTGVLQRCAGLLPAFPAITGQPPQDRAPPVQSLCGLPAPHARWPRSPVGCHAQQRIQHGSRDCRSARPEGYRARGAAISVSCGGAGLGGREGFGGSVMRPPWWVRRKGTQRDYARLPSLRHHRRTARFSLREPARRTHP
jgi:hypothetical protein